MQADTLEQLGYQSESGPWRNFYLSGAQELRQGVRPIPVSLINGDVLKAMTIDMTFDYMAICLDGPKAAGKNIKINWNFTDTKERYVLTWKIYAFPRGRKAGQGRECNNFPNANSLERYYFRSSG